MDLNGIPLHEARPSIRPAAGASAADTPASALRPSGEQASQPLTAPEADGVRGTFEAESPREDDQRGDSKFDKERAAEAETTRAQINAMRDLVEARAPHDTEVSIKVDPDTQETRFLVRDKVSGNVVREVPERDLGELLRRRGSEGLVDRVM